jgi:uncharacterized protein (TIRG00374 family)
MSDNHLAPGKPKSDLRRMLPGLGISLLAVALLLTQVDAGTIIADLQKADFRYLPLIILLFLISMFSRAFGWRAILQGKISVSRAFWTINEGYFLNNLLPFRLGEIGRAFLLNRTEGLPFWEVLPTIMIERIFDVAFTAGMLLISLSFVVSEGSSQLIAYIILALVAVGFMVLFLTVRNQDTVMKWFERLAARWAWLNKFGKERLASTLEGAAALGETKLFIKVFAWFAITWGFTIALYYTMLLAYFPQAELVWATFSLGSLAMGVAIPSSPAQIGVYEWALAFPLTIVGMPQSLALSYAVVAHAVFFLFTTALGAIGLARDGASLSDLYKQLRNRAGKL